MPRHGFTDSPSLLPRPLARRWIALPRALLAVLFAAPFTTSLAQDCLPLPLSEAFGVGTPGTDGVPELHPVGTPLVDQPGMGLRIARGAPDAAAQILVGTVGASLPLGAYGAHLYATPPFARFPLRLDAAGDSVALFQTPAPASPALCGLEFAAQGLVMDASAQGGVAFTAGLHLRFAAGSVAAELFELMPTLVEPNGFKRSGDVFAVADMDGNGRPDIVVTAGQGSSGDVRVMRQTAGGVFAPALVQPIESLDRALDIVAADLDDDGLPDAVTVHDGTGTPAVLWLRGVGEGALAPALNIGPAPGGAPVAAAAGDVTGDGVDDLVVAGWGFVNVAVFAGPLGPGPLVPTADIPLPFPALVRGTRLADVDGDGLLDLVVHVGSIAPEVVVVRALGGGAFAAPTSWPTGLVGIHDLDVADVDGDGDEDVVVFAMQWTLPTRLRVLLSDGAGQLSALPEITVAPAFAFSTSGELDLGDLDDDGLPEALVTFRNYAALRLDNLGGGAFGPATPVEATGTNSRLVDMNGDDRLDLAALDRGQLISSVWWLAGDGVGAFELPPMLPGMPQFLTKAVDLDDDGDLDLVGWATPGSTPPHLAVALNDGAGGFPPATAYVSSGSVRDVVIADMNADTVPDVVVAGGGFVDVYPGLGDGTLGAPVTVVQLIGASSVRVADADADGLPEVYTLGSLLASVQVFPNLGALAFGAPTILPVPQTPKNFDVGDLDGDDVPEIVLQMGASVFVFGGLPGVTFGSPVIVPDPAGGSGTDTPLILADLDDDGDLDMVRRNFGAFTQVWLNDGSGTLAKTQEEFWYAAWGLSVADVNDDGAVDIVGEGVMLGLGGGAFTPPQPGGVSSVHGDLDGDGDPDGAAWGYLFLNRLK